MIEHPFSRAFLVTFILAVVCLPTVQVQAQASNTPRGPAPTLEVDLVLDCALIFSNIAFAVMAEAILATGELSPQTPGDPDKLIAIDRPFATTDDISDSGISNIGASIVITYTLVDIVLTQVLDRGDPWYHYAIVYLESFAITAVVTDLVKIAFRRPRPEAYAEVRETGMSSSETNTALSFFSGHAALAAALSSTAAYLAFARDGSALEGWLVLAGGVGLTTMVSAFRVAEGKHFPTDVIAGALVGASIGVIIPHLHRSTPGVTVVPQGRGLQLIGNF